MNDDVVPSPSCRRVVNVCVTGRTPDRDGLRWLSILGKYLIDVRRETSILFEYRTGFRLGTVVVV